MSSRRVQSQSVRDIHCVDSDFNRFISFLCGDFHLATMNAIERITNARRMFYVSFQKRCLRTCSKLLLTFWVLFLIITEQHSQHGQRHPSFAGNGRVVILHLPMICKKIVQINLYFRLFWHRNILMIIWLTSNSSGR